MLEGRVKRRLRRNGLSEEVNVIEWDKRAQAKEQRSEVERLKRELALKDLEVQSMRDDADVASQIEGESACSAATSTAAGLSSKVLALEQEIRFLKEELSRREQDGDTVIGNETEANWTMAARDPYDFDDDDDDDDEMMITNYDDGFQDVSGQDEILTTPTRLDTSFPSPPSTMPNTPSKSACSMSAGIQASLPIPDPERDDLREQLLSLQKEILNLNSAIALKEDYHDRLAQKLDSFIPSDESCEHSALDAALDSVLTSLALSQSQALEHSTAFSALSTEITSLGFSACSPDAALELISTQFRQARLQLEYLAPGEHAQGFENEKLLGLLLDRIRVLMSKVKERDDSIDQYHAQEVLLRQQLNDRVSVMDSMKGDLVLANTVVGSLRGEIDEKEADSEKLRAALDGYRDEVAGLERLIERLESEGRGADEGLHGEIQELQLRVENEARQHDITKTVNEGNQMLLAEFERRLTAALNAAADVKEQLAALSSTHAATVQERDAALAQLDVLSSSADGRAGDKDAAIEQLQGALQARELAHGSALAFRDAKVSELRREIDRVNGALQTAHTAILTLRRENQDLLQKVGRGQFVVRDMLRQLARAEEMGAGFVDVTEMEMQTRRTSVAMDPLTPRARALSEGPTVVTKGGMFDAGLARRGSGGESSKKRRRYDSGLGFLEEEELVEREAVEE